MRLLASDPDAFRNTQTAFDTYKPNFAYDSANKLSLRIGSVSIFRDLIGTTHQIVGAHPSNPIAAATLVNGLADWMIGRPRICAGWRLMAETYSEFIHNETDKGQLGDEPDFRHVLVAPYVDAITLDRRMCNYVKLASRRLSKLPEPIDYEPRVFRSLDEWLSCS